MKKVGANVGTLLEEVKEDMTEAASSDDWIKYAAAPFAGAARIVLKGPTNVFLGILDKPVEQHTGFETGHTLKETAKEIVTLHPLRAVVHGVNIVDSAILDAIRGIGGFHGKTHAGIQETRTKLQQALDREPSYPMAA
jgi:hypothetical protein